TEVIGQIKYVLREALRTKAIAGVLGASVAAEVGENQTHILQTEVPQNSVPVSSGPASGPAVQKDHGSGALSDGPVEDTHAITGSDRSFFEYHRGVHRIRSRLRRTTANLVEHILS